MRQEEQQSTRVKAARRADQGGFSILQDSASATLPQGLAEHGSHCSRSFTVVLSIHPDVPQRYGILLNSECLSCISQKDPSRSHQRLHQDYCSTLLPRVSPQPCCRPRQRPLPLLLCRPTPVAVLKHFQWRSEKET